MVTVDETELERPEWLGRSEIIEIRRHAISIVSYYATVDTGMHSKVYFKSQSPSNI